jgi:hypothetical protein
MRHTFKMNVRVLAFLGLATLSLSAVPARATDINLATWVNAVKVSGDFRLRQEQFHYRQNVIDRSRQRYRLRVGLELPISDSLTVKTRFATGGAEQVSTNQTLGKLSTPETFAVDRAYLEWAPGSVYKMSGGRMAQPLWVQYSSDIIWDDDFNPEGVAENLNLPVLGPVKFFANGLQMVLNEDEKTNRDQFLFTEQVGAELQLPFELRLKVGYANHNWVNVSTVGYTPSATPISGGFGDGALQDGNRRAGGAAAGNLINHFRVDEWTANLSGWLFRIPISLQGTYIRNNAAIETFSPKYNTGFQHGIIVGKAAAKWSWEAAYFIKNVATDATVADVADSDFGNNGGTNRKGKIYWVALNPREQLQFKIKFFQTQVRNPNVPLSYMKGGLTTLNGTATANPAPLGAQKDINRLQIDMSVKF